jgi:hypothetical protein
MSDLGNHNNNNNKDWEHLYYIEKARLAAHASMQFY